MFPWTARKSRRNQRRTRKPPCARRIRFEPLEDRSLLAVSLLYDVAPGAGNSNAANYVQVGSTIYFTANDNSNGVELWRTDGTTNGTSMVMDIAPGAPSSSPQEMTAFNGKLYFTVNDQVHGRELWVTDGTQVGTQLVLDIDTIASSAPEYLTVVGNELVFSAYDATNGNELWRHDGTNTTLVQDLRPGAFGSTPQYLTEVDGAVFFSANNTDAIGRELWKYVPGNGASLVRNIADLSFESSNPQELFAVGDRLYFSAVGPSDNYFGRELYVSDGTTNGTVMVQDINLGPSDSTPMYLADINGELWFSATTAAAGRELWRSDGTSPGTEIVNDYTPGTGGSNPVSMVYGTAGVFVHYDTYNYIIYYPDSGPVEYRGNNLYPGAEFVPNATASILYFSRANSGFNYELWQIDTATRAVTLVQEVNPSAGSYPSSLAFLNGQLYFTANDGTNGVEPWHATFTPVVSISGLPSGNTGPEGTAINLSANISSPGAGGPYTYSWVVSKQGFGVFATGSNSSFSFTPDDNGAFTAYLTVTDSATQQGQAQQALVITNVAPVAAIQGATPTSPVATSIYLNAQVTDAGILDGFTYQWTVTFGGNIVATGNYTGIFFIPLLPGTYVFDLVVDDNSSDSGSDQETIQVTATPNQNDLIRLYQDLLGRAPDLAGYQYWVDLLGNGVTRGEIARAIMASAEYRHLRIQAFYQQYLGRAAENAALTYWTTFFGNGGTERDFKIALLVSVEYRNQHATDTLFIESLYTNILGRTADSGGVTFWLQVLTAGSDGPANVARALLLSPESYRRVVNDAYQQFLDRALDSPSADYWVNLLTSGAITLDDLFVRICDSDEYGSV